MSEEVVLVTGGTGFIGSHTVVQLLELGKKVIIIDNLANSSQEVLPRIQKITNLDTFTFHEVDIVDYDALIKIMLQYKGKISCVIHFAGLKSVGESVSNPIDYYHNNVTGTINLLRAMVACDCKKIIFSSSATVYGEPQTLPLTEETPTNITNPYGRTKLMIEEILQDTSYSDPSWSIILLRYFNPVGAHPSGLIGEVTKGPPNNLFPYVAQVCYGKRPFLNVYGNDYDTKDGTGLRDYIHVEDLARGHLCALDFLAKNDDCRCKIYNLGTGTGYTVLEVVEAMKKASGNDIPCKFQARRPGDVASCWANADAAKRDLNWEPQFNLERMCEDLCRFQSQNPDGFTSDV